MNIAQSQMDTLFYFGDPMCSWCYGFEPEIQTIENQLPKGVQFKLILGGLRPNGTETMKELGDFLKHHWEEVASATGQAFNYAILEQKSFIYNTEPACRAVVTARQLQPSIEMIFFRKVQEAFYQKNKDVHSLETYLEIAKILDLDQKQFTLLFQSKELREKTYQDFYYSGELGIRGFPSMVLKRGEQYHLLSNGYQKAAVILEAISTIRN